MSGLCIFIQLVENNKFYFLNVFSLESSVKFSQSNYTLSENQGVINIDVVHIGVSEMSIIVKLLVGNEGSSSTTVGKQFQSVRIP